MITACLKRSALKGFSPAFPGSPSWRKRENFREAFEGFDFERVARFTEDDVERLLTNAGIVRHGGKIRSTINNAKRAVEMADREGSLAAYFWRHEPPADERPAVMDYETLRANPTTRHSTALSKDLKKRGWSFVGPTTVYAFMQAMGLVNDHLAGCCMREEVEREREALVRPG